MLQPIAIGSLPQKDIKSAMGIVKKDFSEIPFLPQLVKISKNEGMIFQILEGMPSFCFEDYEKITLQEEVDLLQKYKLGEKSSCAFLSFLEIIKNDKPEYAKIQIVGPYTIANSLHYLSGDDFVHEIGQDFIIKFICLKILWQLKEIKLVSPETIPIVFIDEPGLNIKMPKTKIDNKQKFSVVEMLFEICTFIRTNGALCGIHCCAEPDWEIFFDVNPDIISFGAYSYFTGFAKHLKEIKTYLNNGGKIAWGIVPTFDEKVLKALNYTGLVHKFADSVNYLTKNGIDEKLIIENSFISSSCGGGWLSEESAQYAMDLVKELSVHLRKRFRI